VYILGIETSSDPGSVALATGDELLEETCFDAGAVHARDIIPHIDAILLSCGVDKSELGMVSVSIGPGSFTGLRVGVTCAKSLAYALKLEAVGVCSLESMVFNVDAGDVSGDTVCPLRDARRNAVYGRIFKKKRTGWEALSGVMIHPPHLLAERLPRGTTVFGTGACAYPEVFKQPEFCLMEEKKNVASGRAGAVALLGGVHAREGRTVKPMELAPKYYRLTKVEEQNRRMEADL